MVGLQDLGNLVDGLVGILFRKGGSGDALDVTDGKDAFLDGGVGCDQQVVLVHSHAVVSLGFQHAHDFHRDLVEADGLSERVFPVGKEFVHDRLADDAHLGGVQDVVFGEARSAGDLVAADIEILLVHAVDGGRRIAGSLDGLAAGIDRRGDFVDVAGLGDDGFVIGQFERLHA